MASSEDLARLLLERAAVDETAARELLPLPRVTDAIVAFHAQQAVEKALKAVLASRRVAFPFTHDLAALEELCANRGIDISSELADVDRLTPYATRRTRYGAADPATVDRESALALASAALAWARAASGG